MVENRIAFFEKKLKEVIHTQQRRNHCNPHLTINQLRILHTLKQNPELIILPKNKNLDPAILNRKDYILQILQEHLLKD
jgi:hypothetical protein